MYPLGALPGAEEEMTDQRAKTLYPHPFFTAGAELPGSGSSPPFLGQNKNIAVKKEQLHGKRPRHAELLESPADSGESGQGKEREGAANSEDTSDNNREKRKPAAGDSERSKLQHDSPVDNRVEYADNYYEWAEEQYFSGNIGEGEIPGSNHN